MDYIDTNDYPGLYSSRDIQRYGRFRPLPDTTLKPSVRRELDKIENGRATLPEGERLMDKPLFENSDNEDEQGKVKESRKAEAPLI